MLIEYVRDKDWKKKKERLDRIVEYVPQQHTQCLMNVLL